MGWPTHHLIADAELVHDVERQQRDVRRGSAASDSARKWASGCLLSGECIKACDYGVNPRFLLAMARVAMAKAKDDAATQRRAGVDGFRAVARDVNALSRLQLDDALLARLGQVRKQNAAGAAARFRVLCRLQRA